MRTGLPVASSTCRCKNGMSWRNGSCLRLQPRLEVQRMRHIIVEELSLESGWHQRALEATRGLMEGKAKISDYQGVWGDLKPRLFKLFNQKCWFCETPVDRSDNAVDHFRPKGRVSDASQPHEGYAWLCFELRNFRFECTFCNSRRVDVEHGSAGGKAARFPLVDERKRVYGIDPAQLDYSDLLSTVSGETAAILDPCDPVDWQLLGCRRENGKACPATENRDDVERVEKSIEVYHLDYEPTCKQRHTLAVQLLGKVRTAKAAFLDMDPSDVATKKRFKEQLTGIRSMLRMKAPFSGEMIYLLQGERCPGHPWIESALSGTG